MESTPERQCKDCVHFLQYFIQKGIGFMPVISRCNNNKVPDKRSHRTNAACDCFKEKDLEKEKEDLLKSATEYLGRIAKYLDELTQILKMLIEE